jgi:hypothetical protein
MRQVTLALLLLFVPTSPILAESIVDTYIASHIDQDKDAARLNSLDGTIQTFFSKYDYFSEGSPAELAELEEAAKETLSIIDRMKKRGESMFIAAEHEYELFCFGLRTDRIRCSESKVVYKRMIADTIELGGIYYTFSDNSIYILAALGR